MLAGLSSLRKNPPAESRIETSTSWKNPVESRIETSTSWEERMLSRESGGRFPVGARRKEKDEEQQEKEVKCESLTGLK